MTPGSYAKSVTAFGREYIAISDKFHGSDIAFQWDGVNLNRVTQDGPGTPPVCASVALSSVGLASTGSVVITPVECDPAGLSGGNFTSINIFTSSSITGVSVGNAVVISGCTGTAAPMNGTWIVLSFYTSPPYSTNLIIVSASLPSTTTVQTGATATVPAGVLIRQGNIVTATTAAAHSLQVGYQVQIAGVPSEAIGGGITSIVINNESLPGLATVTTANAHGLSPGSQVNITAVTAVAIGSGISAMSRAGGITTVTTVSANGLTPGASVVIAGSTVAAGTGGFDGTWPVLTVNPVLNQFTFAQTTQTDATAGVGSATLNLAWPIPDTPEPTFFEVIEAPTPTTFQVQVNYSDGTWATGTVSYPWDGIFFVTAIISPTVFQYKQYGPDANSNVSSGTSVTPNGQAAPGTRQCQVLFLTNQGYITRPSPPVSFVTNGGQYISVSNIPIGPSNIVARILAFTGAFGGSFFYIPVPAQANGQQVSTATQINDNTTTTALLDFGDPTLYASLGLSIPGNTPAAQIVLDGALGFGFYASRLVTWGQRNRIQNLLNLSFDGGALPSSPTIPTGWTPNATGAGGALAAGHWNPGWAISAVSPQGIHQPFYEDAYGAPIATPNATYTLRCWLVGGGGTNTVVVKISSVSVSFNSTATVSTVGSGGAWVTANFTTAMPVTIPTDMILTITGTVGVLIDEISIIYAQSPYLDNIMFGSYIDNPEAFDGLSGKFGASQDTRKIMDFGIIRQSMNFLTQDPSGRLHQVSDNGTTEPSGWTVNEIASDCGVLSAFGLTKSQADDNSASGGEEWISWISISGARIFGGDQPWKISQEIQPNWDAISEYYSPSSWALNDPVSRTLYFGVPDAASTGAPTVIYIMSYRQLDTATQIATSPPIRVGFSGKLIATDHTRKWSPWRRAVNGAALMYRQPAPGPGGLPPEALSVVLMGGNGAAPGVSAGYGNVYTLSPAKLTDDDYGQVNPYYTIAFLPSRDQEEALHCQDSKGNMVPLGGMRKLLQFVTAYIPGTGNMTLTYFSNSLTNPWALTTTRALTANPKYDLEFGGGSAIGQRIAIKFASSPASGTDNGFSLQRVTAVLKHAERLQVRGAV